MSGHEAGWDWRKTREGDTVPPPPRLGRKTTTANISLSQMSSKLVPQPRTCSSKTSLSVAAAGLFDADDEADDDFDT